MPLQTIEDNCNIYKGMSFSGIVRKTFSSPPFTEEMFELGVRYDQEFREKVESHPGLREALLEGTQDNPDYAQADIVGFLLADDLIFTIQEVLDNFSYIRAETLEILVDYGLDIQELDALCKQQNNNTPLLLQASGDFALFKFLLDKNLDGKELVEYCQALTAEANEAETYDDGWFFMLVLNILPRTTEELALQLFLDGSQPKVLNYFEGKGYEVPDSIFAKLAEAEAMVDHMSVLLGLEALGSASSA